MKVRVGFTVWENRIAPVCDVARELEVVDIENGELKEEHLVSCPDVPLWQRGYFFRRLGINVIVCGAISKYLMGLLQELGIEVIAFTAGALEEVKEAFVENRLFHTVYAMPGCQKTRRGLLRRCRMQGQGGGRGGGRGQGQGMGRGQGQGRGRGRVVDGVCVCPKCGYSVEHVRGMPCFEKKCPNCNIPLMRG